MIEIAIAVDSNGSLRSLKAEGHSLSGKKGRNIVCSAVSALLRSAVRALGSCKSCKTDIAADRDGFLHLKNDGEGPVDGWLVGLTDMLIAGLLEIEQEYPEECRIELIKLS